MQFWSPSKRPPPALRCAAPALRGAAPCTLLLRSSSRSSSPAPTPPGWSHKIRRFQELENKPHSCSPKPALCQPSHRWWWRRLSRETSDRDCPPDTKRLKILPSGCRDPITSCIQNFFTCISKTTQWRNLFAAEHARPRGSESWYLQIHSGQRHWVGSCGSYSDQGCQ